MPLKSQTRLKPVSGFFYRQDSLLPLARKRAIFNTMRQHTPTTGLATLILAGGTGTRMGGCDKPLLPLGQHPVLSRLITLLRPHCMALALSANGNAARYAPWQIPVLPDANPTYGPLAGVLAGLLWARGCGATTLLTVPGDTPFIPPTLATALMPAPAVAASGGRRHHLVATWPVDCAEALQKWLENTQDNSQRRVRLFADTLGMREVCFGTTPHDPFFNINTPTDYATACRWVQNEAPHA